MAIITRLSILLPGTLLGALLVSPAAFADDAGAIRARLEDWTRQFNAGDTAGACELFSRTLVSDVRGQGEAGYDTRCTLIGKALANPERRFHYALDIREILTEGDMAIVRLVWTLTISPGEITSVEPGLDVFRREADGRWRIIRYMAYESD
ncbi:YybH family protein [Ancylobacter amanitiformis]|uniref:Steroid delta-isomerase n=1 Tax=Ancylobacter amanitiformis TaxID=217069 RepID=A0ABU0LU54_9HYPH|nr:nuclear transport factor 2 family protein [Ancylobacter amanitiformis]MDQ0512230.1 steroid delta-isomerase [Ancylobacter amanitiformis]